MLKISKDGRTLTLTESCGIEHREQVIELPEGAFVRTGLKPYETKTVPIGENTPATAVTIRTTEAFFELDNGKLAIRIPRSGAQRGPVAGIRHGGGAFFGDTYFDTLEPLDRSEARILTEHPLRAQAEFCAGNRYRALFTLDAGEDFCTIEEEFDTFEGDQLVWEFGGSALPRTGFFLNSTPCFETRFLDYSIDRELARLGCWSQQSQMNLSDGFAFRHPAENTAWGAVAFEGGSWQGNRGNSIDAVMRRLRNGNRATRRLVPAAAKADALPGPAANYNPARDAGNCTPVLCWEANLGKGRRKWGLIAMTHEELVPPAGDDTKQIRASLELGHFVDKADKAFCRSLQSPLRKRHIEHILPFGRNFDSGEVRWLDPGFTSAADFMHELIAPGDPDRKLDSEEFIRTVEDYIDARVVTFWDGAGIASTNPVSSRRIAPYHFLVEELASRGKLKGERLERLRKRFLYLAMLNHSQGFYAGKSAMLPPCDADSFDPPMKGMANQNFYTDVITVHGMAGLLSSHPDAAKWVEDFITMFRRQLEVHTYSSGLWEESHTYCRHVLHTVLPVLMMLKRRGLYDFFKDETFQNMLGAVMEQISIADVSTGAKRALLPFGDHDPDPRPYHVMWRAYAQEFRRCAPALAAKINYLAKESGGAYLPDFPQSPPEPGCRELKGFGVLFRGSHAGDETLFVLRSGCAWAHHHNDDGSIQLYCGNRMLIGDAGHSGRRSGPAKAADYGHSRWLLPGVEILNYHYRFNRGWVTAFNPPYATSYTPALFELRHGQDVPLSRPIRHFRSAIRLSECAFLIVDSTLEAVSERICFHLGSRDLTFIPGGVEAECGDFKVRIRSLEHLEAHPGAITEGDVPERQMTTASVLFEVPPAMPVCCFLIDFGREPGSTPLPEVRFDSGLIRVGELVLDHREECL